MTEPQDGRYIGQAKAVHVGLTDSSPASVGPADATQALYSGSAPKITSHDDSPAQWDDSTVYGPDFSQVVYKGRSQAIHVYGTPPTPPTPPTPIPACKCCAEAVLPVLCRSMFDTFQDRDIEHDPAGSLYDPTPYTDHDLGPASGDPDLFWALRQSYKPSGFDDLGAEVDSGTGMKLAAFRGHSTTTPFDTPEVNFVLRKVSDGTTAITGKPWNSTSWTLRMRFQATGFGLFGVVIGQPIMSGGGSPIELIGISRSFRLNFNPLTSQTGPDAVTVSGTSYQGSDNNWNPVTYIQGPYLWTLEFNYVEGAHDRFRLWKDGDPKPDWAHDTGPGFNILGSGPLTVSIFLENDGTALNRNASVTIWDMEFDYPCAPDSPDAIEPIPPLSVDGWTTVVDDNFSTWDSANYDAYPWGWTDSSHNGHYDPSIISSDGSKLRIHIHTEGGLHRVAAIIPAIPGALYGANVQAMRASYWLRADDMPGYKAAPLLWPSSGIWPRDGEVDYPEGNFNGSLSAFIHRQGATVGSDQTFFATPGGTNFQDWHKYTIEWVAGSYCELFLDDVSIGRSTDRIPATPMHLVLQFETNLDGYDPSSTVDGYVEIDRLLIELPSGVSPMGAGSGTTTGAAGDCDAGCTDGSPDVVGSCVETFTRSVSPGGLGTSELPGTPAWVVVDEGAEMLVNGSQAVLTPSPVGGGVDYVSAIVQGPAWIGTAQEFVITFTPSGPDYDEGWFGRFFFGTGLWHGGAPEPIPGGMEYLFGWSNPSITGGATGKFTTQLLFHSITGFGAGPSAGAAPFGTTDVRGFAMKARIRIERTDTTHVVGRSRTWLSGGSEPALWDDEKFLTDTTDFFPVESYTKIQLTFGALSPHVPASLEVDTIEIVTCTLSGGTFSCDECVECADPSNPDVQIPPFTPGYLPTFRRQIGDPTTTLDGFICTLESAAMVLDWHTRGAVKVWGGELIPYCGKTEAQIIASGSNLGNAHQAWLHWGQNLVIRSGGSWADLLAALSEGRAVVLQGDYGVFTLAERCQDSFEGGHAISVYPYQSADRLLTGDPLCHDFTGVRASSLQAYAEALGRAVYGSTTPQKILFAVSRAWTP